MIGGKLAVAEKEKIKNSPKNGRAKKGSQLEELYNFLNHEIMETSNRFGAKADNTVGVAISKTLKKVKSKIELMRSGKK